MLTNDEGSMKLGGKERLQAVMCETVYEVVLAFIHPLLNCYAILHRILT